MFCHLQSRPTHRRRRRGEISYVLECPSVSLINRINLSLLAHQLGLRITIRFLSETLAGEGGQREIESKGDKLLSRNRQPESVRCCLGSILIHQNKRHQPSSSSFARSILTRHLYLYLLSCHRWLSSVPSVLSFHSRSVTLSAPCIGTWLVNSLDIARKSQFPIIIHRRRDNSIFFFSSLIRLYLIISAAAEPSQPIEPPDESH